MINRIYLFEKSTHNACDDLSEKVFIDTFPLKFLDILKNEMKDNKTLEHYFEIKNNHKKIQVLGMWVAHLMIEDYEVFILPKILKKYFKKLKTEQLEDTAKHAFCRVAQMMSFSGYPTSRHDDFLWAGNFPELSPLAEYVYRMYLEKLEIALKRYPVNDFVARAANRNAFRGKLLVAQHLKRNLARPTRFFTLAQELHEDNIITRVFFHALRIIRRYSKDPTTKSKAEKLSASLNITEIQKPDLQLIKMYKLPLKHKKINNIFNLAKALIIPEGIAGGGRTVFGFAFNMEKVFEHYVRKLFQEFHGNKCEEKPVEGSIYLCKAAHILLSPDLSWQYINNDRKPNKFLLKPDIVFQEKSDVDEKTQTIVDCKWKHWFSEKESQRVITNKNNPLGVKSEDIRQLFIYQLAYRKRKKRHSKIFLIYPSYTCADTPEAIPNFIFKFACGSARGFPLVAFSFPVFKFSKGSILFGGDEESQCWDFIKTNLNAIKTFDKSNYQTV